jgi:hypothetical protein
MVDIDQRGYSYEYFVHDVQRVCALRKMLGLPGVTIQYAKECQAVFVRLHTVLFSAHIIMINGILMSTGVTRPKGST